MMGGMRRNNERNNEIMDTIGFGVSLAVVALA
jgi:hypothetical protein